MKKKNYIIFVFVLLMVNTLCGSGSPSSIPFSNSYLQRSSGVEALYWNPANIPNISTQKELLILPFSLEVGNDAFSLGLYNEIMGEAVYDEERGGYVVILTEDLKDKILDAIDQNLILGVNARAVIAGFSSGNYALSTATNVAAHGKIDKRLFEFGLRGNYDAENDDYKNFDFTEEHNSFAAIAYQDIHIGYGGLRLNDFLPGEYDMLPNIYAGFGLSWLVGLYAMDMTRFAGELNATDDGMNMDLVITLRRVGLDNDFMPLIGAHGSGLKASFGLSVDAYQFDENHYVTAGLSFDNLLGFIRWNSELKQSDVEVIIDRFMANELEENFYTYINELDDPVDIDSFSSKLPVNMKMGALYRFYNLSASVDYSQYFGSSKAFSYDPEISVGIEYGRSFPLQVGYRFPLGDLQEIYSLGLGYRSSRYEFGIAYQSVGSFFDYSTSGMALSMQMKFRF